MHRHHRYPSEWHVRRGDSAREKHATMSTQIRKDLTITHMRVLKSHDLPTQLENGSKRIAKRRICLLKSHELKETEEERLLSPSQSLLSSFLPRAASHTFFSPLVGLAIPRSSSFAPLLLPNQSSLINHLLLPPLFFRETTCRILMNFAEFSNTSSSVVSNNPEWVSRCLFKKKTKLGRITETSAS